MTEIDYDPAAHYDRVQGIWRLLLGEELHYGLFARGDEALPEATAALTTAMIDAARFEPGLDVLDVGCGSGAPACRLVQEAAVRVVGITTSEVGVSEARARALELGLHDASFELRDGTDNGFADASFDRVWILEASHLMPDRERLVSECARVLRPGGRLVLCDIIRRREIPFREVRDKRVEFATLRAAFGAARMESLSYYSDTAQAHGLHVERADDLTEASLPTFDRWRANADEHHDAAVAALGADGVDDFVRAADILEGFWRDGTLGYGLLAAAKV